MRGIFCVGSYACARRSSPVTVTDRDSHVIVGGGSIWGNDLGRQDNVAVEQGPGARELLKGFVHD